jgi:hypothetical protein
MVSLLGPLGYPLEQEKLSSRMMKGTKECEKRNLTNSGNKQEPAHSVELGAQA